MERGYGKEGGLHALSADPGVSRSIISILARLYTPFPVPVTPGLVAAVRRVGDGLGAAPGSGGRHWVDCLPVALCPSRLSLRSGWLSG